MPLTLTAADAQRSLADHAAAKGAEVRAKYGPRFGWAELTALLADRAFVRYPCDVVFDSAELLAGEAAYAHPLGHAPAEGFKIFVHPLLLTRLPEALAVVLYQLVCVNYGNFAGADDAEAFGAAVLGLDPDEYYRWVCAIHDQLESAVNP